MRQVLFALFLLLPCLAFAQEAHVLKVRDGDSLLVEIDGIRTDVRLIGVDAPEWKQEFGQDAKRFTQKFCSHGPVDLEYDMDRFGPFNRLQAYVWHDGKMLNVEIVRAGLALSSPYKRNKKHRKEIKAAMQEAEAAKTGFWAQGGLRQTPKEFRRAH